MLFSFNLLTAQDYKDILIDVSSLDSDIILDLKYRGINNFTSTKVLGYYKNLLLLTKPAAKALISAQQNFKLLGFAK